MKKLNMNSYEISRRMFSFLKNHVEPNLTTQLPSAFDAKVMSRTQRIVAERDLEKLKQLIHFQRDLAYTTADQNIVVTHNSGVIVKVKNGGKTERKKIYVAGFPSGILQKLLKGSAITVASEDGEFTKTIKGKKTGEEFKIQNIVYTITEIISVSVIEDEIIDFVTNQLGQTETILLKTNAE